MRESKNAFGVALLLAEDDPINADIASRMLRKMGLSVSVAESGRAALECWRQRDFDLVLMDCEMADMDGFEATRQMRAHEATAKRTPIVALTAHSAADIRDRCLTAGMDDVLAKPFTNRQVAALLRRWVGASAPAVDETAARDSIESEGASKSSRGIDPSAFDQVGAFKGKEGNRLLQTLARRFAETAPRQLRSLHEHHGAGASDDVRRVAHTLKSSSAALGALFVSRTCAEIERYAGDKSRMPVFLSTLDEEVPSAVRHLTEIARNRDEQGRGHG